MSSLHHIVYASRAAAPLSPPEVRHIVADADRRNWREDITGALLYSGRHFVQWLEGERERLEALMARIARDPRHVELRLLQSGRLDRRHYGSWGMRAIVEPALDAEVERLLREPGRDDLATLLQLFDTGDPTDTNPPLR